MGEPGQAPGRTAILIDVTNSTRAYSAGGTPDYGNALGDFIQQAITNRDTISVSPFSGTVASLSWTAFEWSTDWKRDNNNPDNQKDREQEAGQCVGDAVGAAQSADPAAPGTDVLRPAAAAAEWLRQGTGGKHLVIATDGLVTEGCASLVKSDLSGNEEIEALVAACSAEPVQELRPDVFDSIRVSVVGIGHPAAGQPVPAPAQVQWLKRLWERFCEFQGGDCHIRTTSIGRNQKDVWPTPVAAISDPTLQYGSSEQRYSLPEAALFDTGGAVIRPDAGPMLTELAVTLRTGATVRVQVIGFADQRGDNNRNRILSEDRAKAVAAFLRSEGVPGVTAIGKGETDECADGSRVPATATSDDETQCARRVDVLAARS